MTTIPPTTCSPRIQSTPLLRSTNGAPVTINSMATSPPTLQACPSVRSESGWSQSVSVLTDADRNGVARAPPAISPSLASAPLQLMAASSTLSPRMIRACSLIRRATRRPGRRPTKIELAPSAHTNARRSISTSNKLAFVRGVNGRCASS